MLLLGNQSFFETFSEVLATSSDDPGSHWRILKIIGRQFNYSSMVMGTGHYLSPVGERKGGGSEEETVIFS